MTKEELRTLYETMIVADRTLTMRAQRDTSGLVGDERFEADLAYRQAQSAYGKARMAYENAIDKYTASQPNTAGRE